MIQKVSHIGIAVNNDAQEAGEVAAKLIGATIKGCKVEKLLVEEKLNIAEQFYASVTIDRQARRYVALQVDDIRASLEAMQRKDIPLIDKTPRIGGGHAQIAFLHPKATKALIELTQPAQ